METTYYLSPIGLMEIKGTDKGIASVVFIDTVTGVIPNPPCLRECVTQLDEYFNKKRKKFSLDLDVSGSEFQVKVWKELLNIPFGKTTTYGDLAEKIGEKEAVRAVGGANGKNRISIIVPCHRVIGNDGKLVGYAGGLWRKQWLLEFENDNKQIALEYND